MLFNNSKLFTILMLWLGAFASYGQQISLAEEPKELVVLGGDTIVYIPDTTPVFPGGESALDMYFKDRFLQYRKEQKREKDKYILISYVIRKTGEVGQVNVVLTDKPKYSERLTTIIKAMPRWEPAQKDGKKVATLVGLELFVD